MSALWWWLFWPAAAGVTLIAFAYVGRAPKAGEYAWFFGAKVPYPRDSDADTPMDKTRADIAEPVEAQGLQRPSNRTSS